MIEELVQEIREISLEPKELKKFGITFLVVLGLIGGFLVWSKGAAHPAPYALFALAVIFGALGMTAPGVLARPYKVWMTFAAVMGFFISRLILSLLFYLVITPMSIGGRLLGKDWLDKKMDGRESYWHLRDDEYDPSRTEKMY